MVERAGRWMVRQGCAADTWDARRIGSLRADCKVNWGPLWDRDAQGNGDLDIRVGSGPRIY